MGQCLLAGCVLPKCAKALWVDELSCVVKSCELVPSCTLKQQQQKQPDIESNFLSLKCFYWVITEHEHWLWGTYK